MDTLSKGYRHRTCFAQSIIHDPPVLVPWTNRPTAWTRNQKHENPQPRAHPPHGRKRKAIVFSTHILEEVEAACSRAIIIDRGRIVANGTPQELKQRCEYGGAVLLIARGVTGPQMQERFARIPNAEKTLIIKEEKGKIWARVYPKADNRNGELARHVLTAAVNGWQVEELHTEERPA